jgi:glycosyltransferase involved in cell wall biosynthesis
VADAAPLVSVVIPTYNRRELLKETIQSVLDQSYAPIEIIVIDDGSTDGTEEAFAELANSGRIQYVTQANGGVAAARNRGLQLARGEFICFLDADDLLPVDKLAWQAMYLAAHPDVGVVGGIHHVLNGEPQAPRLAFAEERWGFAETICSNPFISPGVALARTSLVASLNGFDTRLWATDDWDFWIRASKRTGIVRRAHHSLDYRIHAGNISGSTGKMLAACISLVRGHLSELPVDERDPLWRKARAHIYEGLGSTLVSRARQALGRGQPLTAVRMLAGLRPLAGEIIGDPALRRAVLRNLMGH